jgi:acetoacetate decarboxylase
MKESDVRARAFAMPLTSPAYPVGPYRFINREYLIITYRTDPQKLRELVPEPLQIEESLVKFEFIRMPDSTGFGDYTESGQVIPVTFKGRKGGYSHCMFLDDHPPIAGGRELWGFPKKLAKPTLDDAIDTLVGTLDYGPVRIATGSMGYKHKAADRDAVMASLLAPNFLLKIVPHVDGTARICELVEYELTDVRRLDRTRSTDPVVACAGAARRIAGAGGRVRHAYPCRSDAAAGQGRARLSCLGPHIHQCPLWVKSGHDRANFRCPLCPRKRTLTGANRMSALCQKRTSPSRRSCYRSRNQFSGIDSSARREPR